MNERRDIIIEPGDLRVIGHGSLFVHWTRGFIATGDVVMVLSVMVDRTRLLIELLDERGLGAQVEVLIGGSIERFLVRPR